MRGAAADAPVTMSAQDRERLLEEVYSKTKLENKPRNLIGIAKSIPPEQMEAMLSAVIPVNGDTMRELALQRGLAVRESEREAAKLVLVGKPVRPGQSEIASNPRARSAIMRVAEKLPSRGASGRASQ